MRPKTIFFKAILILSALLILASCEKNPINRLSDPNPGGALNTFSGVLKVYDDDLRTGGNVEFIPSDFDPPNNTMSVDFKFTGQNPPEGSNCLMYSWNGNDVLNTSNNTLEHTYGAMSLIVATHWSLYNSTPGKDFRGAGYTHISFKAKADIAANTKIKFEGPLQEGTGTNDFIWLTTSQISMADWQEYSIPLTSTDLGNVKDYFKIVIKWTGSGYMPTTGTVFVDDIRYER